MPKNCPHELDKGGATHVCCCCLIWNDMAASKLSVLILSLMQGKATQWRSTSNNPLLFSHAAPKKEITRSHWKENTASQEKNTQPRKHDQQKGSANEDPRPARNATTLGEMQNSASMETHSRNGEMRPAQRKHPILHTCQRKCPLLLQTEMKSSQ
jgi:hypothetical protein